MSTIEVHPSFEFKENYIIVLGCFFQMLIILRVMPNFISMTHMLLLNIGAVKTLDLTLTRCVYYKRCF